MYKNYFFIGFLGFLLFVFVTFSIVLSFNWIRSFDTFFIECIRGDVESNLTWNQWMKFLSNIGDSKTVIVVSFVVMLWMFWKRKIMLGIWFIGSIAISMIILKILKEMIARPRPNIENWLSNASGFSYPSGHSLSISIFCLLVFLFIWSSETKVFFKFFSGILAVLLIFSIMYSRIYLGVHYPSDVFGGFLLGLTLAFFSRGVYLKLFKHKQS
ncbi:phosphatase PAP2 family protein [Helicobacter cappadocius]|uniref:Phosphatase PAP2 family protein n=1 Tax=Helicobacter cappadocius TaxID=3063998 RepID=A0AA90TA66_9HELI|nr:MULTISPECIES: phosphatase PAP2 family protein [unclassified Helicobacter]MDO7253695.1 phosphatase PAP2 family protein [Helicobacter sp. faydin-H75]MDP2539617.1 phosphatase PAP2 family protein [Helicobacter sp. faydin-H76]